MAEIIDEPGLRNRLYVFEDRFQAGELLVGKLEEYRGDEDAYVLAIPAGGVQVAVKVAKGLGVPLDVVVTRKLHIPWNREAGFGAVSWDGLIFLNERLVAALRLTREEIDRCVAEERQAIDRRLVAFRGDRPFPDLKDKTAIVVDDGLASGFSMMTTLRALRRKGVREAVVAVPTAPVSALNLVKPHASRIICLNIRSGPIFAVADAYKVWYDLTDGEVVDVLEKHGFYTKDTS
ncbi:MAG: phosphoribosyltransferase family protein [Candidatus Bathyarchaeota archaeon]|nr:phosphoribosyltransferase family protein [Candidatus Bathyarchaeota archaeon]